MILIMGTMLLPGSPPWLAAGSPATDSRAQSFMGAIRSQDSLGDADCPRRVRLSANEPSELLLLLLLPSQ